MTIDIQKAVKIQRSVEDCYSKLCRNSAKMGQSISSKIIIHSESSKIEQESKFLSKFPSNGFEDYANKPEKV
jgi:hypothetical protein